MKISQRAFDMCIAEEVSSQAYYTKHYQRPEWPGLSSGVTVAIGYDLGQCTRDKIRQDWNGLVSPEMLMVMMSCSGLTGGAGKRKLAEVKSKISIPWGAALKVFATRDVPSWTATVLKDVPGANKLTPSCLGVLFDIAYNRGAGGFNSADARYREMRAIRIDVTNKQLNNVPLQIRNMKRLWPNTAGLLRRCDHRIALWQYGMTESGSEVDNLIAEAVIVAPTPAVPDPAVPLMAGPARTPLPATTTAQHTVTAVVGGGGLIGTWQAWAAGLINNEITFFCGFLSVLAAITIWWWWYRDRNPKP